MCLISAVVLIRRQTDEMASGSSFLSSGEVKQAEELIQNIVTFGLWLSLTAQTHKGQATLSRVTRGSRATLARDA